jgi:hypothetical protein
VPGQNESFRARALYFQDLPVYLEQKVITRHALL